MRTTEWSDDTSSSLEMLDTLQFPSSSVGAEFTGEELKGDCRWATSWLQAAKLATLSRFKSQVDDKGKEREPEHDLRNHKLPHVGAIRKHVTVAHGRLRYEAEVQKIKGGPRWTAALQLPPLIYERPQH